jgi:hypothetical protein
MERTGTDLIAWYLSPDRLLPTSNGPASTPIPSSGCASGSYPGHRRHVVPGHPGRRHAADRQRRATAQEGGRLHALISALVGAAIRGGYLANARLKEVHWQAGKGHPAAVPKVTVSGESQLFVDPAEIPGHATSACGHVAGRAIASITRPAIGESDIKVGYQ